MGEIYRPRLRPWLLGLLLVLAVTSVPVRTQSASQGTLLLRVQPECVLLNSNTTLAGQQEAGTLSGVSTFQYKLRTSGAGGAAIQMKLDQPGAVVNYVVSLPGSAATSGSAAIPASGILTVANFGPNSHSSRAGDTGMLTWSLPASGSAAAPPMVFSISCH